MGFFLSAERYAPVGTDIPAQYIVLHRTKGSDRPWKPDLHLQMFNSEEEAQFYSNKQTLRDSWMEFRVFVIYPPPVWK